MLSVAFSLSKLGSVVMEELFLLFLMMLQSYEINNNRSLKAVGRAKKILERDGKLV